jgi:transcriptional regulator with XRE-family HTH domain
MENLSEIAARIKALRGNQKQVEFAERLGVRQATVSSWESGQDAPTPLSCLLLGLLASASEREWFFKQAGDDLETMMVAADAIRKERAAAPLEGEIIRIPRVRKTATGMEDVGKPFPIAAERVPNSLSTDCLDVDETIANPMLAVGDLVIFDKSERASKFLSPFWEETLLVDVDMRRARLGSGGVPTAHIVGHARPVVCIGNLRCRRVGPPLEHMTGGGNVNYHGILVWHSEPQGKTMTLQLHTEIVIGRWQCRIPEGGTNRFDEAAAYRQALREMQCDEACQVLGRVIAWLPSPSKSGSNFEGER